MLKLKRWAGSDLAAFPLGAAAVFCFAPFGFWWLAFPVCLGLFLRLRQAVGMRRALRIGGSFGLGFFLAGVSWIYVSLSVFGGMPGWLAGFATFLFCATMALYFVLFAGVFKRWQPVGIVAQALFFGALWMLFDWLRGWLFTGFPWLALGYSQVNGPIAGFAPLLGVYGLSLIVATVAALLAQWRAGLPVLLVVLLAGFCLKQIAWTTPVGKPVSVALVQGNVAQEMKWEPSHFIRTLHLYRDLVREHPAALTVLPETAVPAFFDQLPPEFVADLKRDAQRQGGDLIMGAVTGDSRAYWNTAVTLGASPTQSYSKHHLLPFGEFIPSGFSWFLQLARIPMSEFSRGPEQQPPFAIAGQQVAADICYEDVFGEEIIRALPAATMLVNISNTAWFGHSLAQPQHLQISQMRALETGRPMLRATNTGMTAVIRPDGEVQAVLSPFVTDVLEAQVQGYSGLTPYARGGNWGALLLALVLLLAAKLQRPGKTK